MNLNRRFATLFSVSVLLGTQFVGAIASSMADEINVLVPAYANPCCDGGPAMWAQLISTANDPTRNFELHIIFNPNSGPGTERELNYLDSAGNGPLASARNAGAFVHGYVPSGFGQRDITLVKSDIDQYLLNASLYQGFIDGIFIDEMSNDLADVGYYQEIAAHVEMRSAGALTFGNPGTTFVNNPTGQTEFTSSDFGAAFDTVMTFENTGDEYRTNYTAPVYLAEQPASGFAHAIHSETIWDPATLPLVTTRKAGFLYVTDDIFLTSLDNPWDQLTTYWDEFTADLIAHNSTLIGDFDGDGDVDADDINFYSGNLERPASFNAELDLDSDDTISLADHDRHVTTFVQTSNGQTGALIGDIDLDGSVDVLGDAFILIANLNATGPNLYSFGDLNADQSVDVLGDAFRLISNLGQTNSP